MTRTSQVEVRRDDVSTTVTDLGASGPRRPPGHARNDRQVPRWRGRRARGGSDARRSGSGEPWTGRCQAGRPTAPALPADEVGAGCSVWRFWCWSRSASGGGARSGPAWTGLLGSGRPSALRWAGKPWPEASQYAWTLRDSRARPAGSARVSKRRRAIGSVRRA